MTGKPTETVDPNSRELTDPRPAAEDPAWDQIRSSACGGQFCNLVCF